jgi:hypothetical protein
MKENIMWAGDINGEKDLSRWFVRKLLGKDYSFAQGIT